MPKKYLDIWTTEEIKKVINDVVRNNPTTTTEYRQGWEDALANMWERVTKEKIAYKKYPCNHPLERKY